MKPLLLLAVLAGGCAKKEEAAPPAASTDDIIMPAAEMTRARDACADYIKKVCACTKPEAVEECKLAKLIPDAIDVAREVSVNPESERDTVLRSNHLIRQNVKSCIQKSAALTGC